MSKFSGNREDGRRGLSFFGGFWFDIVQVDCRAVVLVFDQKINVEEVIVKIQVVSQIVGFGVFAGGVEERFSRLLRIVPSWYDSGSNVNRGW